jgi:hypothetical protein
MKKSQLCFKWEKDLSTALRWFSTYQLRPQISNHGRACTLVQKECWSVICLITSEPSMFYLTAKRCPNKAVRSGRVTAEWVDTVRFRVRVRWGLRNSLICCRLSRFVSRLHLQRISPLLDCSVGAGLSAPWYDSYPSQLFSWFPYFVVKPNSASFSHGFARELIGVLWIGLVSLLIFGTVWKLRQHSLKTTGILLGFLISQNVLFVLESLWLWELFSLVPQMVLVWGKGLTWCLAWEKEPFQCMWDHHTLWER